MTSILPPPPSHPDPLPPGSGTAFPALRAEVVSRLHAYRREVMKRAYLLLGIFLVGVAALVLTGWWLFTNMACGWGHYAYLAGFAGFLIGMMALFLWRVYFGTLDKFGLRCGGCRRSFLEMDSEILIRKGRCDGCGQTLIRDAPDAEDAEDAVVPVKAEPFPEEEHGS